MRLISAAELRARLCDTREHTILDVRREGDFAKDHLFHACNIPRSVLELRIEQLVPRTSTPITIAAKGRFADDTGDVLAQFGYTDVRLLDGENAGWSAAGGQLFSGMNVPSKAFGEFIEIEAGTPHIAPEELAHVFQGDNGYIVLDSRPFAEYQVMNIPGAVNCPGAELVYRFFENVPSPDTTIFVNCAGRTRSIIGAQSLIDAGVPNRVVALRDGTMGWHLAGFTLHHGGDKRASSPQPQSLAQARTLAARRAERVGVTALTPAQCDALLGENNGRTTYLFDVRDPPEYAAGHRRGAVSAPGGQLVQTFDAFVAVQNARLILCDSDGVRAPMTAAWLRQMGQRDVFTVRDDATDSNVSPPTPKADAYLESVPAVSIHDAAQWQAEGHPVFDLGSSKDYRRSHIAGARFSERHRLASDITATGDNRSVIVTSSDGQLARLAARDILMQGHPVFVLEGGTCAWIAASLPRESGTGNLPAVPDDVFYKPYDLTAAAEDAMRDYLEWEKGLVERIAREPGVAFHRVTQ